MKTPDFPALLQKFFLERLLRQRQVSAHTLSAYRDSFRLLLQFAQRQLHKPPSQITLPEVDAPLISAFLDDLERSRKVCARSRNLRLSALRSFFRYVAFEEPAHSAQIQRVLAIPSKRAAKALVSFLTRAEVEALLAAPNVQTWRGRRDRTLLLLAVQTGLRLSELTALRREDLHLGPEPYVHCLGKGRKERCTPLTKATVAALKGWLQEPSASAGPWLFSTAQGTPLSADAVQDLVAKHGAVAARACPSLKQKRLSPHVLRHTLAMELLQAGVDQALIALLLGHESVETVQVYLHADLALKEQILRKTTPLGSRSRRFKAGDRLLAFLKSLGARPDYAG